jgi:hypothetical protein
MLPETHRAGTIMGFATKGKGVVAFACAIRILKIRWSRRRKIGEPHFAKWELVETRMER